MDPITSRLERLALENQIKACGDAIEEQEEVIHNLRFIHDFIGKFGLDEASLAILNESGQLSELLNIPEDELGSTGVTVVQEGLMDKIKEFKDNLLAKLKARKEAWLKKCEEDNNLHFKGIKTYEPILAECYEAFLKIDPTDFDNKIIKVPHAAKHFETGALRDNKLLHLLISHSLEKTYEKLKWINLYQIRKELSELIGAEMEFGDPKAGIIAFHYWDDEAHSDDLDDSSELPTTSKPKKEMTYKELGWSHQNVKKLHTLVLESFKLGKNAITFANYLNDLLSNNLNVVAASKNEDQAKVKEIEVLDQDAWSTIKGTEMIFDALCNIILTRAKELVRIMKQIR